VFLQNVIDVGDGPTCELPLLLGRATTDMRCSLDEKWWRARMDSEVTRRLPPTDSDPPRSFSCCG
jgi:hypothetical protein